MVEIEKPRIECVENPGDGSYGKMCIRDRSWISSGQAGTYPTETYGGRWPLSELRN